MNHSIDDKPIIIVGPSRWPKSNPASVGGSRPTRAGRHLGDGDERRRLRARTVRCCSTKATSRGHLAAAAGPHQRRRRGLDLWASDRVVFQRHNPPPPFGDDPFPASLSWFSRTGRPLNEIKEVVAVDGNTITFSTPIHITYTVQKQAQLTRYTGDNVHVRDAGIEDLGLAGGGDGSIRFEAAAYSWVKNVGNALWIGGGVGINHSFRVEIRDSALRDGAWRSPAAAAPPSAWRGGRRKC
ncbi:MAG: hypothetical protein R2708_25310 [Vicinamibacterales bacterium]